MIIKATSLVLLLASWHCVTMAESIDEGPTEPGQGDLEQDGPAASDKVRGELYGFVMADMGYNNGTINSDWYDVMRPTQLPASARQRDGLDGPGALEGNNFPTEGNTFASVRQTRFGIKGWIPTEIGELHTIFEWELFGVGDDAGQTTFRLRHAYGELGQFGAGQYWSPFMDIDVFPNSLEYWGPSGMPFFRNIQVRWMPLRGANKLSFALEKPGGSRDPANEELEQFIQSENSVRAHFPLPDLSAAFKLDRDWGYVRLSGILRRIEWQDEDTSNVDLSGETTGWGINLSSNIRLGPNGSVLKLLLVHGKGIENYMNDAGGDIGLKYDGDTLEAEAIPVTGLVAFYDYYWNKHWSSSLGFSSVDKKNPSAQAAYSFEKGRYALVNLQYHPASQIMVGAELQYGKRENFDDGWDYDIYKLQISARYNFSFGLGT